MRRKPGTLLPIEVAILQAAVDLVGAGQPNFHGYMIASEIRERENARALTSHGTLYKALDRMKKAGYLESSWEDPDIAVGENRPRRRLYRVTAEGQRALQLAGEHAASGTWQPGMQPT
jgi:DNA-binding PadR family transcriptional regulator